MSGYWDQFYDGQQMSTGDYLRELEGAAVRQLADELGIQEQDHGAFLATAQGLARHTGTDTLSAAHSLRSLINTMQEHP